VISGSLRKPVVFRSAGFRSICQLPNAKTCLNGLEAN
jgi:hypothetical protein